ncbi:Glucose/sorbosone dehydrogenase-like protein [unidentified eubacterium SCB49]|nr:Glucose/sorbosone dehydrogenase-like protein [unidentified eubacterium SCB49]
MKNLALSIVALSLAFLCNAQSISLEPFASGLSSPVDIKNAGDDRLFVVEKTGQIVILDTDGNETSTFLNITSLISGTSEQGLLGLAFHPEYSSNGYFFVNYTDINGDTQVSRFTVSSNPDIADASSELKILDFTQPYSNHNGGSLEFGPDGFLYIGTGDGGNSGDPNNYAQNKLSPLGKMLRIDIDNTSGGNNYSIPANNPYLGDSTGLDEIWAIGLRNPWKYDFDPESNDLWIADVGQNAVEEINRVDYTVADLNYGWRCYEASSTYETSGCPAIDTFTFPVFEYPQTGSACSITGGKVYRGNTYPDAQGYYFYADLCDTRIGAVSPTNQNVAFGNFSGNTWTTFGRDVEGEIYIGNFNGTISKITDIVIPLSIDSFTANGFTLFPNPATDQLTINSTTQLVTNVAIYNVKGSLALKIKNTNTLIQNINTSELKSGFYIIKITTEEGKVYSEKLVIK